MRRIAVIVVAIAIVCLLLSFRQGVNARGYQFKGVLPPEQVGKGKEVVKEDMEEVPEEGVAALPPSPVLNIIINIPAKKVILFDEGREVLRYDIAIGQPAYKTPRGQQEIEMVIWNPWWLPPDSPWAAGAKDTPPGPHNPLGPVKMMMGQGLRLHGTNKDSSVGTAASHGCLRMHNEEAVALAWYIQKRLNNSEDALLEKYRKNRGTSFYVKLTSPVGVDIIYDAVELRDDTIYIYNDIYGWARDIKVEVIEDLIKGGIDLNRINADRVGELNYPKKRGNVTAIKIVELLSSSQTKNGSVANLE